MPTTLNHMNVRTLNNEAAARFYEDVMGFPYDGAVRDITAVRVNDTFRLQFRNVDQVQPIHLAFYVSEEEFDAILARLRAKRLPYGNRADERENMRTDHLWGCRGVYFQDPDGHSLELVTKPFPS